MVGMIGLDFETYSATDLKTHGLARYVKDPAFRPLIASVTWNDGGRLQRMRLDFARARRHSTSLLRERIGGDSIVAQNAGFEEAVLTWLGLGYTHDRFIDSAVVARAAGAGSHLEACAPQLLDVDKMASGMNLIKLFSVPGKYQEASGSSVFDPQIIDDNPVEWGQFGDYCDLDSELGLTIAERYIGWLTPTEMHYQAVTMRVNSTGWPVDLELVKEMQDRYLENMADALSSFQQAYPDSDINLNSLKQMKEWCAKRGIKATSFDEKHVQSLLVRIDGKVATMPDSDKRQDYMEVMHLLRTKQVLGGSSLKKLQVILDTVVDEGGVVRLKDQYVHCGAGQTLRTSGRSVQMQNLKQLSVVEDVEELDDQDVFWDNTKLAENLRQVFTASDVNGRLIVGDFKSVESRGLAYMADEAWKVNAYRKGEDIYQLLADRFGNSRKFGKVGELSCGYGAGGPAVQQFASKMGIELSEGEANGLVHDWRGECPRTLEFWENLNAMLHSVLTAGHSTSLIIGGGMTVRMIAVATPVSLLRQHPKSQSIELRLTANSGAVILKRFFHGCYMRGRNVAYYKPSDRKTGDLWRTTFTDPKTKQLRYYELYGGKLAGILTQSLCREIFMHTLLSVNNWWTGDRVQVIGQFHDEIVLDWKPGGMTEPAAQQVLYTLMSTAPSWIHGFPLDAEIKSAYRYIK